MLYLNFRFNADSDLNAEMFLKIKADEKKSNKSLLVGKIIKMYYCLSVIKKNK